VDGNVARVFARLFAIEDDVREAKGTAKLWRLAEELVHAGDPGAWNQALMELGATVCTPREPRCLLCPARDLCRGRAMGIERELPRMKPKTRARVERRWALVATRGAAVLLGQRHAELRFGGMWEPPSVVRGEGETEAEGAERLARLTGAKLGKMAGAGEVTHVLSHRRLEIEVLSAPIVRGGAQASDGSEYVRFELVDPQGLASRGISALARKILVLAKVR
jgi:A/G-specific adenine glycosylase